MSKGGYPGGRKPEGGVPPVPRAFREPRRSTPAFSYTQVREYLDWLDKQEREHLELAEILGTEAKFVRGQLAQATFARAKFLNIMAIKKGSQ